ncbi:WG repeat-containing protein [Chitinophaga sp. RAB17]|uniref:WG repeat-containing protein n=1 Tax=Chitinophaga sp. RAB17 TaxID=3233049 RepID=UPI003F910714
MNIRLLLAAGLLLSTQAVTAQKGSVFVHGFARIEENGKSWFINTKGEKAFDQAIATYHPIDSNADKNSNHQLINDKETMMLVSNNGKMGVVDDQGNWLLQPVYDTVDLRWKSYLELHQGDKMAYADTHGKLLLPMQFQEAGILDDDHFDVKVNGKWGIFSVRQNKLVIPAIYEGFDFCSGCGRKGDYVFAQQNGLWGVVTFNNEILVPFEYEHEHYFMRSDNWVLCFKKKGQEVVLNMGTKKEYVSPEYTNMELIGNGLLKAKKNGYYGLINEDGTTVADFVYEEINSPYGETGGGPYLAITKKRKTGILREDGKVIIPPAYDGDITCFADCFIVPVNGNYNLLDTTGKKLLPKDYTEITGMNTTFDLETGQPLFKLKQKALYGFYNPLNKKTVAPAFFEIDRTGSDSPLDGLLEVSYQEKKGLYNAAGEQLLPAAYQDYAALTSDLLWVKQNGGSGVYDIKGKRLVLPATWYSVALLDGDSSLLLVTKYTNDNYNKGLYDSKGAMVLPPVYSSIEQVGDDQYLLSIEKEGKQQYSMFNSKTKQKTPLLYDYVKIAPQRERLIVAHAGRAGIIDTHGHIVIPVSYEKVTYLKNNCIQLVKKGDAGQSVLGYADINGKLIVPLTYEEDSYGVGSSEDTAYLLLTRKDAEDGGYRQGLASTSGVIVVPPVYDRVLSERSGLGFLVQKGRNFTVLNRAGQPLNPQTFDDVVPGEPVHYGGNSVVYSFPLLCRQGEQYQYMGEDGKLLPLKITEVITFSPAEMYGIPAL